MKQILIPVAIIIGACSGGLRRGGELPDPCPDTTIYTYRDTASGVLPPLIARTTLPRRSFNKVTVQGVVGRNGRIERGTIRTFGADLDGQHGDALFWTEFQPARLGECAVRFLYRITYIGGLPQNVPEEVGDTAGGHGREQAGTGGNRRERAGTGGHGRRG